MMKRRVDYLDGLRAIAIFMVVGIHAIHYTNIESSLHNVFMFLLTSIAVPIFFFVDGYLFTSQYRQKKLRYSIYLIKSARRLLLPWLIFSVVYIMIRYAGEVLGVFGSEIVLGVDVGDIVLLIYGSDVSSQLYFLPALFIIRAIAFITKRYLSWKVLFMCLACIVYVSLFHALEVDKLSPVPLDPFVHAIWGLQFYMLGVLSKRMEKLGELQYELVVLAVMLVGIYLLSAGTLAILQILYLYGFYYMCKYAPSIPAPLINVGKETMGIYLLHAPVIIYSFSAILTRYIHGEGLLFVSIWVASFFVSFYLSRLISSFQIGALMFGGEVKMVGQR